MYGALELPAKKSPAQGRAKNNQCRGLDYIPSKLGRPSEMKGT